MNVLVLGLGAAVLGIGVHALTLRYLAPRFRLLALPAALLMAFAILLFISPLPEAPPSLGDCLAAFILTFSIGFAYALMLVGVIYDSPTLALVNAIRGHEPNGMPVADFDSFVAKHPFFQSRLDALIDAGELGVEGDELRLTGKTSVLLRLGEAYRRLRGDSSATTG